MTTTRALLASLLTVLAVPFLTGSTASAEASFSITPDATSAAPATAPPLRLAQAAGPVIDKKAAAEAKKAAAIAARKAKTEKAQSAKQGGAGAKQEAIKNKKQQFQQAKENSVKNKKKQGAAADREQAVKAKQLQMQQAKDKALKSKQDAAAGRDQAVKAKQLQMQQAKDKALKSKQDAAAARDQAVKAKQLQMQQAKDKALNQKQDAAAARDKSIRDKLNAAKAPRGAAKFDRANVDVEFDRARKQAQDRKGSDRAEKWQATKASKFEALRKGRKTREEGSRNLIFEPDKRVIVRDRDRTYIRHDESSRFRKAHEVRRERRKDGTWLVVTAGLAGALIYALQDDDGRVIRRSRKGSDGREYVFFDDRRSYHGRPEGGDYEHGPQFIDLPPPTVSIPRDRYILDYDRASQDDIYETLEAPPIEDMGEGYSLDEVRQNYPILERMRRVDLDSINFEFASWEVDASEFPKLERMARAMERIIAGSPGELFLIEGHTDAVGSEIDNLSLSDRRAETVGSILSEEFGIPPENITTQGYGEEHLKELTEEPSWINRRVSVRRITPLLSRKGWDDGF